MTSSSSSSSSLESSLSELGLLIQHGLSSKGKKSEEDQDDDIVDDDDAITRDEPWCGNDVPLAIGALARSDVVCFDVDSTIIAEEGVDVLAEHMGMGDRVSELTKRAMDGGLDFRAALETRLDLLRPSRSDIRDCLRDRPPRLSPGAGDLVDALQRNGKRVYLVSGGFRPMIEPVAMQLNIPMENVVANTILFHDDGGGDGGGTYRGFDPDEPTSADGGKPKALRQIMDHVRQMKQKERAEAEAAETTTTTTTTKRNEKKKGNRDQDDDDDDDDEDEVVSVMIGDGATDAQAKPPATAFIGYGGVIVRPNVRRQSCWYVDNLRVLERVVRFGKMPPPPPLRPSASSSSSSSS